MSVSIHSATLCMKIQGSLYKFTVLISIAALLIGALVLALITITTGIYPFRVSRAGSSKDVIKTFVSVLSLPYKPP